MPDPKQMKTESRRPDGKVAGVERPRSPDTSTNTFTDTAHDGEALRRVLLDLLKRRREGRS